MKRLVLLVLLVSLGLNVGLAWRLRQAARPDGGPRFAHGERFRPAPGDSQAWHERMDRRHRHMTELLGLDADQQEAFRRHRETAEADIRARMFRLEDARAALRAEAERRPLEPAAVAAALAAVGRAEAAIDSLVAANLQAELELLQPDQQARLLRLLRFERMGVHGGMGPGHGRHHGPGGGRGGGGAGE